MVTSTTIPDRVGRCLVAGPSLLAGGLVLLLALAGCGGSYRPGVDGSLRTLPQNASANAQPQPAGSLPR